MESGQAAAHSTEVPAGTERVRRHKAKAANGVSETAKEGHTEEYAAGSDEPRSGAETSAGPSGNGSQGNNASDASAPSLDNSDRSEKDNGTDESSSTGSSQHRHRAAANGGTTRRPGTTGPDAPGSDPSSQDANSNAQESSDSSEGAWSSQNEVYVTYNEADARDDIFEDVITEQPPWVQSTTPTSAPPMVSKPDEVMVVLKNLDHKQCVAQVIQLAESFGFTLSEDCIQSAYVPCNRHQTRGRGYALLLCASPQTAERLAAVLDGYKQPGQRGLKATRQDPERANGLISIGVPSFSPAYGPVSWKEYNDDMRAQLLQCSAQKFRT